MYMNFKVQGFEFLKLFYSFYFMGFQVSGYRYIPPYLALMKFMTTLLYFQLENGEILIATAYHAPIDPRITDKLRQKRLFTVQLADGNQAVMKCHKGHGAPHSARIELVVSTALWKGLGGGGHRSVGWRKSSCNEMP